MRKCFRALRNVFNIFQNRFQNCNQIKIIESILNRVDLVQTYMSSNLIKVSHLDLILGLVKGQPKSNHTHPYLNGLDHESSSTGSLEINLLQR